MRAHEPVIRTFQEWGEQNADMDDLVAFGFQLMGEKPPENWTDETWPPPPDYDPWRPARL